MEVGSTPTEPTNGDTPESMGTEYRVVPSIKRVIAIDTESTGLDWAHGAMPWLVSVSDRVDAPPRVWRWWVDPVTRFPEVPPADVQQIRDELAAADVVVAHNGKFDAHVLSNVGIGFPWEKLRDTLIVSHLLASNHPHNLTDTVMEHLHVDILPLERAVEAATKACRQTISRNEWLQHGVDCSRWRLAKEGLAEMPSVGGGDDEDKPWKADMWVAHSLAEALLAAGVDLSDTEFHQGWLDAPIAYAEADPAVTLAFWMWAEREVERRGLGLILADRMGLARIAYDLESHGVTASEVETASLILEYSASVDLAQAECVAIADRFDFPLDLPSGAAPNDSVKEFMWGSVRLECPKCGTERVHKRWERGGVNGSTTCKRCAGRRGRLVLQRGVDGKPLRHLPKVLVGGPEVVECVKKENPYLNLPYVVSSKTGNPTLDADAMRHYLAVLETGPALEFVEHLASMRSRQTAVSYMRSYGWYWLPTVVPEWRRIHSHGNPTATDTLRWAFNDPNTSNISDKEDFSLRRCFGPMPGREWWKMDFKSIERRIPAYESGEPKMIGVFEEPDEPPYWGNLYCLTASVLYPEEYWPRSHEEGLFKRERPQLYRRAKFFDLARQYGCGRKKGDLLSGVPGSSDLMSSEFPLFAALQRHYLDFAERWGYVETIPDREVDSLRGYPLLASRGEDGRVNPTTPFCYHVSGTAMQCTNHAMLKTERQVKEWNAEGWDGFLTLQVHDELVWDCPRGTGERPWEENLHRMDVLRELMESVGNGIGVPTPVSREYFVGNYARGTPI